MNALQEFMAACNVQARPLNQEEFQYPQGGAVFFGTFGNPQLMPVQTRVGYQDHLVTTLIAARAQFAADPAARQMLFRIQTRRPMFIQIVDFTDPVVYTFILTDREL